MGRKRGRRKKPFKLKLKKEILYSIVSLIFAVLAVLILLSFTRQGLFLATLYEALNDLFGWTLLMLPFISLSLSLLMTQLKWPIASPTVFLGGLLIFIGTTGISKSGGVGEQIFASLEVLITAFGAAAVYLSVILAGIMVLTNTSLDEFLVAIAGALGYVKDAFVSLGGRGKSGVAINTSGSEKPGDIKITGIGAEAKESPKATEPTKEPAKPKDFASEITASPSSAAIWKYPPLSLLAASLGGEADRGDVKANASIIENALDAFGIRAKVKEINGGPSITQYALSVPPGTKLSKVNALQKDLALALAAPTGQIRIEAPIPGRSLIGIEVPNRSFEYVTLKKVLSSNELKNSKSKLAFGLGLNVSGATVVADIKKMPHLLIAGATGSGKSVCINTLITTLLYRNSPQELRFIMVDPKRVELTGYNGIPHLLTPVIHDAEKVIAALQWTAQKMDERYKLFAEVGARNIDDYNELSGFTAMESIVIVIDELADIMLFAPSKVEDLITRLAQMARATGIHLILATQRPSVNVITGLIKANVPARIAFNVTSMIDSRVIIDMPGAEKLLGKGDMLFVPPDQALPTRIQGTYVSNEEIRSLIDYLRSTNAEEVHYQEEVTEKYLGDATGGDGDMGETDELFEEAARIVIGARKGSTSYLQRRLSIGYNRAGKIMDQLQQAGIVGPPDGSKPREVLVETYESYTQIREANA